MKFKLRKRIAAAALAVAPGLLMAQAAGEDQTSLGSVSLYRFYSVQEKLPYIPNIVVPDGDEATPPAGEDLPGGLPPPPIIGEVIFKSGTRTLTIQEGVHSISLVQVTGGQGGATSSGQSGNSQGSGGAGGQLRYINDIKVSPGDKVTVVVSAAGSTSTTGRWPTPTKISINGVELSTLSGNTRAEAGNFLASKAQWPYKNAVTNFGGAAGTRNGHGGAGGGGAAGFYGPGGKGGNGATARSGNGTPGTRVANNGGGGGGAGGGATGTSAWRGGAGGGVGLFQGGESGSGGKRSNASGAKGSPGSAEGATEFFGGGGGGGGWYSSGFSGYRTDPDPAGGGAVRIIWPGNVRSFPDKSENLNDYWFLKDLGVIRN